MRNHFLSVIIVLLFAGCTRSYDSLKTAGEKVQQPASISTTSVSVDSGKKSPCSSGSCGDCKEDQRMPAARYSWDTKMVLW